VSVLELGLVRDPLLPGSLRSPQCVSTNHLHTIYLDRSVTDGLKIEVEGQVAYILRSSPRTHVTR
jgi:hypothetical protein